MLDEIEIYIKDRFTPEMCDSVKRLFNILDSITEDDYQQQYMSILMQDGSDDGESSEERFTALVFDNIRYVLKLHAVTLADDVPIYEQLDLIEGILALAEYEDKQVIMDQIDASDDAIDALASVLQLTTTFDETKVYSIVQECEVGLITQLRALCDKSQDTQEEQTVKNNALVSVLKKLRLHIQYPQAKGFELIQAGLPIGASFSNYLPHFVEIFKSRDISHMAKELMVLLYMSGDSHKTPLLFFKQISNTLFEDLSVVTKMEIEMTRLMSDFESTFNPRNQKESNNA